MAMDYFGGSDLDVRLKDGESPVTKADYAVDRYLRETLLAARPDYGWLSEETADDDVAGRIAAPRTFIADPIDGTRAFIAGHAVWCVSVGLVEDGKPVAGVLECPALGETISATLGGGAWWNGQSIRVAGPGSEPLIGGPRGLVDRFNASGAARARRHSHVPSLAYRLAMVARGSMDGSFVKPFASDWDIAAAALILTEAGGVFTDGHGDAVALNGVDPLKGTLVACHPDLQGAMLGVVGDLGFG
jgi:myo-inositol-1(or 4)-monophosphatase